MGRPKRAVAETPADEASAEEAGPSSPKQQRVETESESDSGAKEATKKTADSSAASTSAGPKKRGRTNAVAPAVEHAKKYFEEHKDGCEIVCSELLKDYESKHPCYNYFSNKLKEALGDDLKIVRAKGKNARDHTLVYKKN